MDNSEIDVNAMKQKIAEEYLSSLADLNVNSKPLINMLTILAEENIEHAEVIVKVVEQHIAKVNPDIKLPVLYLIDSIVKNVGGQYIQLFSQCIVNIFVGVFDKVKENVREKMYTLRQTWVEVFPPQKLYTLDVKVKCIDQNWPITAKVPTPSIHVNPKFLAKESTDSSEMQAKLLAKQRELLELQNRKLEMELEATRLCLKAQEQKMQSERTTETSLISPPAPTALGGINTEKAISLQTPQINVHVNKNYPFNQIRGNIKKNPAQNMFPAASNASANKPRVAPVNSAMLSALSRRDPRLARQQQQIQQDHNISNDIPESVISTPILQQKIDSVKRSDEDSTSSGQKKSESRSFDERNSNKSRPKSDAPTSNKDRRSPTSREKGLKNSEKSKGLPLSRSERKDKDRHKDKDKKFLDKKLKDLSDEKLKSKDEKYLKDTNTAVLTTDVPLPPKVVELSFNERVSTKRSPSRNSGNHKSSPLKELKAKEIKFHNKSPSPSKEKAKLEKEQPEKKIKLISTVNATATTLSTTMSTSTSPASTETTASSSTVTSNIIKEKLPKIPKLEQNKDDGLPVPLHNSSKDVDLRNITKMDIDISPINNNEIIDKITKSDEMGQENLVEIHPNVIKKRPSCDEFSLGEPIVKKSKVEEIDEKIDILFGTEDVDLRKLPAPEVSPPPPPVISNESENWAKVKGIKQVVSSLSTSLEKFSNKSSLDDVRAKLAKAAKNNNYSFGKGTKKTIKKPIVEEFNEDSQDGASENIRTIINQAQELLESKSISSDQYNTLVKTAMQINETNKLKEAQRRESLTLQNDKENKNDDTKLKLSNLSPKEQRKKLPKIPKTTDSKQIASDTKALETKKSEVTQEFKDIVSKHKNSPLEKSDEKDKDTSGNISTRRRRKESKWSAMTPWEIQQQKQQNWMMQQQQPGGIPPPPFPPKLLAIPPVPTAGLQGTHNQWQNPPSIIFGGNAIQPIAAASVQNLNNNSSLVNPGNAISGPAFSNSVNNPQDDIVRTIPIDGVSKEIRIYDDVAIVFMDWDQPREIGFQNGQRRIIIDNQDPIALNFNEDFVNITISGSIHRIKYGFPSRELYIDANWYECYFGGPPFTIPLDGKFHVLQIEGPPPQVHIGPIRQDLVVGKINLVIDAHVVIPVFLDSRVQSFELYNKKHVIQFADALSTALIDNEPIEVEYGGLPKSFDMNGEKHFIRFTTLPNGILPGKVNIKNMIHVKSKEIAVDSIKPDLDVKTTTIAALPHNLPPIGAAPLPLDISVKVTETTNHGTETALSSTALINLNSNTATSLETVPGVNSFPISNQTALPNEQTTAIDSTPAPVLPSPLNIDELFQKLIASGILNKESKPDEAKKEEEKEANKIVPIDLKKSESIKTRQAGVVNTLFSGMQCSSCGLRFPPEQTMKYSQHLDWHFRQNRRERDSNRKAHSRKWYYDLSDWLQYEEIEDLEDREKNWFETQQVELETDENSNQKCPSPQPSCRAESDDVDRGCEICLEKFEHFYNEELEEWHLKSAIKVDDLFYHPICYKDLQDAIAKEAKESSVAKEKSEEKEIEETECIEIDDSVVMVKQEKLEDNGKKQSEIEEDDDDVIVLPNEEPSITEIPDDDDDEIIVSVNEDSAKEKNNQTSTESEKSSQIEVPLTNESIVTSSETVPNTGNKVLGNISMEDDILIEEPQIPFQDLDTYVEKDLSHLNEESTQSSFANIKIKEEPKDDDEDAIIEEDDVFEDVGTVEIINDSIDSPLITTPILDVEEELSDSNNTITTLGNDVSSSVNVSIDGNIRINNVPSQNIGVNKIKINITKNIVNSSNNSNLNNVSLNENNSSEIDTNKIDKIELQHQQRQQNSQISTIPVITTNQNFNRREFSVYNNNISTMSQSSTATTTITNAASSINVISNNLSNNNNKITSSSSSISNSNQTISLLNKLNTSTPTSSLLSNSTTLISIPTTDIEPTSTENNKNDENQNETPKMEFKVKPELQNVEFKTVEKLEKGYETSGLCSIM
ncbi:uncharacterized protein LOC129606180 [Condylostylus longicornis]|uniref:uncharacterized protein LOC129606180 n=1 Tax=Condylostylus longicornis TaxID=2530218 RepID=UPI00244E260A|nr:uncharacterized protein LOC129606180 [Condylostylus longicornis]